MEHYYIRRKGRKPVKVRKPIPDGYVAAVGELYSKPKPKPVPVPA